MVLLDNGRSSVLGSAFEDMLRCIRCGACMNHCPVYHSIGGHAYGYIYPGPIGAVLTPSLIGIDKAGHLPNASTFCGRCEAVSRAHPLAQADAPLARARVRAALSPATVRGGLKTWGLLRDAARPLPGRDGPRHAGHVLGRRGKGRFASLPMAAGWTDYREHARPQGGTFQAEWQRRKRGKATT